MAHHGLKGRRKPRPDASLKARKAKAKHSKPVRGNGNDGYKNMKERRAGLKAAAEQAKKAEEEKAARLAAKAALKAKRKRGPTEEPEAAEAPEGTAPGQAAVEAPAPALAREPEDAATRPAKLSRKERKMQEELLKQNVALYPGGERVLLVGEGNFSFARALCRRLGKGDGLYATAFDSEAVLNKKYPDAAECRKEVEEFGGVTLVGVDATMLHKVREFRGAFSKVVWNFPHAGGGEKDVEKSIAEHRKLLAKFFSSAAQCLDPERPSAAVHVALKVGEPYKSWKVVQVAHAATEDLLFQTAVPFSLSAWSCYSHRRTAGFSETFSKRDSEELAKGAKVYVFVRKRKQDE